jgi:hypothetical protein
MVKGDYMKVFIMTLKTPEFTAVRIFRDAGKAVREASIARASYKAVIWNEIKNGHISGSGKVKITVVEGTLE